MFSFLRGQGDNLWKVNTGALLRQCGRKGGSEGGRGHRSGQTFGLLGHISSETLIKVAEQHQMKEGSW